MSAPKHIWAEAEDFYIRASFAAGKSYRTIGGALGLPAHIVATRGFHLGLTRDAPADAMPRVSRWSCDYCGTRSDAALDFGCGQCLPVRRAVA